MSEKVSSISEAISRSQTAERGQIGSAEVVSLPANGKREILQAIDRAGLKHDLHSVWTACPNLEDATIKLLARITCSWPCRADDTQPAVVAATLKAVRAVKRSIERGERSRSQVVAAYLGGLASVADDVAAVHVWGFRDASSQERWSLEDEDLGEWASRKGFTQVKFFHVEDPNPNEVAGTRMKLLCAIANTRDVGLVGRFH